MNTETCHCPCCQQGISAPHDYHLERRPMQAAAASDADPCWRCNGEGFVDVSGFGDLATCEDCRGSGRAATPTPVPAAVMPGDCIHCGKEICNDLGWCNSFKAVPAAVMEEKNG